MVTVWPTAFTAAGPSVAQNDISDGGSELVTGYAIDIQIGELPQVRPTSACEWCVPGVQRALIGKTSVKCS